MKKFHIFLSLITVLLALFFTCPSQDSGGSGGNGRDDGDGGDDVKTYAIGDTGPSGVGIVFYITAGGLHGLEAAPSDQSAGIRWNKGINIETGAIAEAIGTGQQNTTAIVTTQGAGSYAAQLCNDLIINDYDDWFLPSYEEIHSMYLELHLNGIGGFTGSDYWSSSEANTSGSYSQHFSDGAKNYRGKSLILKVRAVRVF